MNKSKIEFNRQQQVRYRRGIGKQQGSTDFEQGIIRQTTGNKQEATGKL